MCVCVNVTLYSVGRCHIPKQKSDGFFGGVFCFSSSFSKKQLLLEAISNTDNGKSATSEQQKRVLELVQTLESLAPSSTQSILTNPKEATKIDGVWYLQYTSPSTMEEQDDVVDQFPNAWKPINGKEGISRIDTQQVRNAKGSIQATGITVDTSNRMVQQIFNIETARVQNKIDLNWGRVEVEGNFRPSTTVPNRAIVGFDRANIFVKTPSFGNDKNNSKNTLLVDLSWIFNKVLPLFKGGSRDNGWVETTFIDEEIRIGRGNKGTLFVITRSQNV